MTHDPVERDAKRRALEDLYGAEVIDSVADRVVMRDVPEVPVVRSVN